MQADRFTIKSQEALHDAITAAHARKNADVQPTHLLLALLDQPDGLVPAILRKLGVQPRRAAHPDRGRARPAPDARHRGRAGHQPGAAPGHARVRARDARAVGRVRLDRAPAALPRRPQLPRRRNASRRRRHQGAAAQGTGRRPRRPQGHRPEARGQDLRAGEVRARPHRAGRERQARPGHRPRRRDPPRHPGPQPPHQEQPGPDRRARRRQDGDRRGPRSADRLRRRPRVAARIAA